MSDELKAQLEPNGTASLFLLMGWLFAFAVVVGLFFAMKMGTSDRDGLAGLAVADKLLIPAILFLTGGGIVQKLHQIHDELRMARRNLSDPTE